MAEVTVDHLADAGGDPRCGLERCCLPLATDRSGAGSSNAEPQTQRRRPGQCTQPVLNPLGDAASVWGGGGAVPGALSERPQEASFAHGPLTTRSAREAGASAQAVLVRSPFFAYFLWRSKESRRHRAASGRSWNVERPTREAPPSYLAGAVVAGAAGVAAGAAAGAELPPIARRRSTSSWVAYSNTFTTCFTPETLLATSAATWPSRSVT